MGNTTEQQRRWRAKAKSERARCARELAYLLDTLPDDAVDILRRSVGNAILNDVIHDLPPFGIAHLTSIVERGWELLELRGWHRRAVLVRKAGTLDVEETLTLREALAYLDDHTMLTPMGIACAMAQAASAVFRVRYDDVTREIVVVDAD